MKKKILMFLTLFAGALTTWADNTVSVSSALIPQGKSGSFNIELSNPGDAFVAFQMKLTLPEGITFESATKSDRYIDNPGIATNGQTTTFTLISPTNETIKGESGALLTINVTADVDIEPGTKLSATLSEMEFGRKNETYFRPEPIDFEIEITNKVILDENSTIVPAAQSGVNVLVKRTIKKDVWSTIVLPFQLTKTKAEAAFGSDVELAEFTGFETIYASDEDVTPDALVLNFTPYVMTSRKGMTAGKPFLIKTSMDIESFEAENVTISNAAVSDVAKEDADGIPGSMTGSFVKTTIPADGLFISNNQFWYSTGKTKTKAFRCWFELGAVLNKETNFEARVFLNFDNVTTGVAEVEDGIRKNESGVYDLLGRRVTDVHGGTPLPKGLYVKDGKKVIIK